MQNQGLAALWTMGPPPGGAMTGYAMRPDEAAEFYGRVPPPPQNINRAGKSGLQPAVTQVAKNPWAGVGYNDAQRDAPLRAPLDFGNGPSSGPFSGAMPPADYTAFRGTPSYLPAGSMPGIGALPGQAPEGLGALWPSNGPYLNAVQQRGEELDRMRNAPGGINNPAGSAGEDVGPMFGMPAPGDQSPQTVPANLNAMYANSGMTLSPQSLLDSFEKWRSAKEAKAAQTAAQGGSPIPDRLGDYTEKSPNEQYRNAMATADMLGNLVLSMQPETAVPMALGHTFAGVRDAANNVRSGNSQQALVNAGGAVLSALGAIPGGGIVSAPARRYAEEAAAAGTGKMLPVRDRAGAQVYRPAMPWEGRDAMDRLGGRVRMNPDGTPVTRTTGPSNFPVESPQWEVPAMRSPSTQLNTFLPVGGSAREEALAAARGGATNEDLWKQAGMFIGPEGVPMREIPDAGRQVAAKQVPFGSSVPLSQVLPEHGDLFAAMPWLRDLEVRGVRDIPSYNPQSNVINMASPQAYGKQASKRKLFEGVQAAIQEKENLAGAAFHKGNVTDIKNLGGASKGLYGKIEMEDIPALAAYTGYLGDHLKSMQEAVRTGQVGAFPWAHPEVFAPQGAGIVPAIDAALGRGSAGKMVKTAVGNRSVLDRTQLPGGLPPELSQPGAFVLPTRGNAQDSGKLLEFIRSWYANPYRQALGGGK